MFGFNLPRKRREGTRIKMIGIGSFHMIPEQVLGEDSTGGQRAK
jgi:hypothetical protein